MALTVERMFYRVCQCGVTNIWYAAGDAGLISVQEPTVTKRNWASVVRTFKLKRWDFGWRSSKDSVWYKIRFCCHDKYFRCLP